MEGGGAVESVKPARWIIRYAPILVMGSYLNLTVFLFAFGPWPYPIENAGTVYTFLLFAHLAILGGYFYGSSKPGSGYGGRIGPRRLLLIAATISILIAFPSSATLTGSWIPNALRGVTDAGIAYTETQRLRTEAPSLVLYVRMIFGPFLALVLPLTVFYWSRIPLYVKVLGAMAILMNIMLFAAMGTNQGVAVPFLVIPWLALGSFAAKVNAFNWRRFATAVTLVVFGIAFSFFFFIQSTVQRQGSLAVAGVFPQINTAADYNNFLVRDLSPDLQAGMLNTCQYLTQGYYGLSLAFTKPYIPTYGIGYSTFLDRQVGRLIGQPEGFKTSYPERMDSEDGWTTVRFFQTIYPWFASDVTFPGVIVLLFIFGAMFAQCWSDVLLGQNPFAVAFLAQLLFMFLYIPALNAALQDGEGFGSFWGLMILWLLTRRRAHGKAAPSPSPAASP